MTISDAITRAAERLTAHRIPDARLDAEVLLGYVLGRDRGWLLAHAPDALDDRAHHYFEQLLDRRAVREPLQYITGRQEFWGIEFAVTPDVLIPRPETELVVESTCAALRGCVAPRVMDICTGSGCIAVSLAKELPGLQAVATDRSAEALTVARTNARTHRVTERIRFLEGDLFGPLGGHDGTGPFDAITANPPYVRVDELAGLQPEVRDFEPEIALIAGTQGTEIAERILAGAPAYLRSGGPLVMEMGAGQAEALRSFADRTGAYGTIDVLKDLAGIERVIVAKKS